MSSQPTTRNRRKSIASVIAVVIIVVITGLVWFISNRTHSPTPVNASTSASSTTASSSKATTATKTTSRPRASTPRAASSKAAKTTPTTAIPARVAATLALIDAGRWPDAANAPGTQGGRDFRNNEGLLPRTDSAGRRMRYQEWDVNPKQPNRGRDAERIITAADGSAWYTLDHYRTFIKIRGPSS